jgi:hypothetical protein
MLRTHILVLSLLTLVVVPGTALSIGPTETGRQIVAACKAYLALSPDDVENARHPQHHCRQFIASFLSAYATGEGLATQSRITGVGSSQNEPCVRLPDHLSFRDMAARMIAQSERDPASLDGPATELAQKTLEHDFPCEAGRDK